MKLSLRHLILSLALLSALFTVFSMTLSGYRTSQQTLIANTLETNRVYAQKLSSSTEQFFAMTLQTLEYSSKDISVYMNKADSAEKLKQEADRLKSQTNTFNSVVIANADGEVLATSPQTLDLIGKLLDSTGGQQALKEKRPLISKPYLSMTGRLIIFISHPIFDSNGDYIGLVGGSLYLKEDNILYDILGAHYYKDDSYVFVTDEDGRIIYHQMQERVNDEVPHNPVVQRLMNKESGSERITNSQNVDMLAGYAYIPTAGWGVVSQRPTEIAIAPAIEMMNAMILRSLPFFLLSIFIILIITRMVAQPLHKLAHYAETSTENDQREPIKKIIAWYYEAIQLKSALSHSISFFHDKVDYITEQSRTDPLTKLANRRTLDEQIKKWADSGIHFSIVILDIDHFKRVNDAYGHSVGDDVLIFLADQLRDAARTEDVCCRYGGEEFVLLLHKLDEDEAYTVAEQLRKKVASTISPCGERITISAGIASYPTHDLEEIINAADECLYEAKKTGRNKCVVNAA